MKLAPEDHGFVFKAPAPDGRTTLVHFVDWRWCEINHGGYATMALTKIDLVHITKMNHGRTRLKSLFTVTIFGPEGQEFPAWTLAMDAINGDESKRKLFLGCLLLDDT